MTPQKPPREVDGAPVYAVGKPTRIRGHLCQTILPEHLHDGRIWQFNLHTGRLILIQGKGR